MTDALRIAIRKFDPFAQAIARQWADFQAVTGCPLRLEAESLDLDPLVDTLFTRGGLKDGVWDIAFIVTDWLADAVAAGSLLDLAPLMAANPVPDYPAGWSPSLTEAQRFGDAVYGLPYHDGPECLVYRTDLFADPTEQAAFEARHGYPLAVPTTWAQFEDVARFFTRPADGRYGTIFAAYPDGHNAVYDFCLQLWSRGGEVVWDGAPTLATREAVAALDFYRRLVNDRSVTPPGQAEIDSVQSGEWFARGAVAMMTNWFGFAAVAQQPGSPVSGKVGVAPLPAAEDGTSASLNVYWLLAIGTGSRHHEEAYAFIRHCCTREMDKLTTLTGGIGCRRSTWDDPDVNALIPFSRRLPELHAGARTLPRSRDWPRLAQIVDAAMQEAIATDRPTDEILRAAQERAAAIRL